MRFHIGFSKRIKVKTLIEIIGFVFVGLCAFFGFTQHGYAWTLVNTNTSNSASTMQQYFHSIETVGLNSSEERVTLNVANANCYSIDTDSTNRWSRYWLYNNCSSTFINENNYIKNFYQGATMDLGTANQRGITLYSSYNVYNNNYCTNDSSNKSVNIKGSFLYGAGSSSNVQNLSFFNKDVNTMFSTSIFGRNNNNESLIYGTPCTTTLESSNSTYYAYYYSFTCNNVKVGSDIDYYDIHISNNYTDLSDVFKTSGNKRAFGSLFFNITYTSTSYNVPSLQYECSTDNANVIDPPVEPNALDDFYEEAKEHFDSQVAGLDTEAVNIPLPEKFSDLLTMPLDIVQAVVDNSNTCTPATIDFTSIVRKWGNPNGTYVMTLPCMRSTLSSMLYVEGLNLYNLVDVLLAAIVFYNVIMNLIQLVDALTSGEDLYSYFFRRTDQKAHINHKTGEVS